MTRSLRRAATAPISGRFGPIAVAAAAEHGDDPAGRERPRRLEQVLQRIVGVRVVHDHADVVAGVGDDLKAARARPSSCAMPLSIALERQVERGRGRDGGEDVVGVGAADQPRLDVQRPARRASPRTGSPSRVERQVARPDVRGGVDRIGDRRASRSTTARRHGDRPG